MFARAMRSAARVARPGLALAGTAAAGATVATCSNGKHAEITSEKQVAITEFLRLKTLSYTDEKGTERHWDCVQRIGFSNAVAVFTILKTNRTDITLEPECLLTVQFKPPVGLALELPTSIMLPGESAEEAAVRTVKQNTGYRGVARKLSGGPILSANSCGLSDEKTRLVVVEVDLDADGNHKPKTRTVGNKAEFRKLHWHPPQELEEGELPITVHRVKLSQLGEYVHAHAHQATHPAHIPTTTARITLRRYIAHAQKSGVTPWVGLQALAMGIQYASGKL